MKNRMEEETEKLLLEHYDELYRLAYCYVKTETDALDIVQEAAYKAFKNCGKVREPAYLKTWICRIVINTIALESMAETLSCLRSLPVTDVDIVSVSAARSKSVGRYHMMMGQNPVYIISCTGGPEGGPEHGDA